MIKYICDICKSYCAKDDLLVDTELVAGCKTIIKGSGVFQSRETEWQKVKIDICKDCYNKLITQINELEANFYQNRK